MFSHPKKARIAPIVVRNSMPSGQATGTARYRYDFMAAGRGILARIGVTVADCALANRL
jgi:hypothetical protein